MLIVICSASAEQFIDGSLIGELEREGFFKRIYTR